MELIWNEIEAARLIYGTSVQTVVEGSLPPVDGRIAREVLDCSAGVFTDKTDIEDGMLMLSGAVSVSVVALDNDSVAFAFESNARFTHTVEAPGAEAGMKVVVTPSVQSLTARAAEDGVELTAVIDMDIRIISTAPIRVTDGVTGVADMETKTAALTHSRRIELGSETLRLREELAEDGVADVAYTEGQVYIRDVAVEQGGATVSGVITVSALCTGNDGKLSQLIRQIPFRERLAINGASEQVFCTAQLNVIAVRSLGAEFALLSMEAEVSFKLFGIRNYNLTLPIDAFSPSIGFCCLHDNIRLMNAGGECSLQSSLRETVTVPDGMAEIANPLFASARPIVTGVANDGGSLIVEGILVTSLVYESSGNRLYTFTEDVPFSIPLSCNGVYGNPIVGCSATASVTGCNGQSAQIAYTVCILAELYSIEDVSVVTGLVESEPVNKLDGIIVCFAAEGESLFDIAKRYSVSCESVKRLNPDIAEPLAEGERLLLFV